MLTYEDVKNNSAVRIYIQRADESLTALGYTEPQLCPRDGGGGKRRLYPPPPWGIRSGRWSWQRSPGFFTTSATW